ncbi:ABC transporter permease [Mahella australiensis]|uniref:Carbohydrate ABC transporter membrane protein 1, CUT1 family n=1 Tax=Mahella australiensis (strain DSM 15567 / CIP 107919 / 50-1 BON) TaxID=697281 RepID=F3ZY23_MAHA5|nr:sugar ABC transporter permease [Mahella australiensis]AEE97719.1 carbohydrate ABC transporter membrane protein 1, CUT1 family [Mahella australiensis 50-1 BON]
MIEQQTVALRKKPNSVATAFKRLSEFKYLYIMLIPGITYFVVFHYIPMYGVTIAFKDFKIMQGIIDSPWVGLKYFKQAFESPFFAQTLWNTFIISVYKLLWGFPAPIILALLLNEVKNSIFKRTIQTISYLPHFLSWVVIGGILTDMLSPQTGVVNNIIKMFGGEPIYFMASKEWFRTVLVASDIWKEVGWGSIIYLAALSGIDPQLYEASQIDGANRWQQTWHITLPGIRGTIAILLILRLGNILNAGFEQIFIMYNSAVYEVSDIIDTWVYRIGLQGMQYSLATAVGLFKSLIGLVLVVAANWVTHRMGESGIW